MPVGISPLNVLKYLGPRRGIIPIVEGPRRPTVLDRNYLIGTQWRVEKNPQTGSEGEFFLLVKFESNGDATWQQLALSTSSGDLDSLSGDSGTSPVLPDGAGNIAVTGDGAQGVSSVGGTNALEFTVADATTSSKGVVQFDSGDFSVTSGVVSLASSSIILTLAGDSGSAVPTLGTINVVGSNGITTQGSGDTLTVIGSNAATNQVTNVTTNTVNLTGGTTHIINNGSQVTATLPATCSVGDYIRIVGYSASGYTIAQNASQTLHFFDQSTTTGVGGSATPSERFAITTITCVVANTDFVIGTEAGNYTLV